MNHLSRSFILFAVVILITALVPIFGCPSPSQGQSNLTSRVEDLEAQVADLQAKLKYVSIQKGMINGLKGPHFIIEGCNVHIESGSGNTDDNNTGLMGRGNLIIGYNEPPDMVVYGRLGSHNLVIGPSHEYSSFGGFIGGYHNATIDAFATVSGGAYSTASGLHSSVNGGEKNEASGLSSSVSGGLMNTASADRSSVVAGVGGAASGAYSSVNGGFDGKASGYASSVSGGLGYQASGDYQVVP